MKHLDHLSPSPFNSSNGTDEALGGRLSFCLSSISTLLTTKRSEQTDFLLIFLLHCWAFCHQGRRKHIVEHCRYASICPNCYPEALCLDCRASIIAFVPFPLNLGDSNQVSLSRLGSRNDGFLTHVLTQSIALFK